MDKNGHVLAIAAFPLDAEGNLMEDAPRPPVPGKEDLPRAGCRRSAAFKPSDSGRSAATATAAAVCLAAASGGKWCTPRRHDYDLGFEPEGSAGAAAPYARCAETLPALLDDPDGAPLLRDFLRGRDLVDLFDFWFACKGLREQPAGRAARLARAIYKRYVADVGGVVASRLKPPTRSAVREAVLAQAGGGGGGGGEGAFDRAQAEVQRYLEEAAYPAFLRSDAYLRHALAESAGGKERGKAAAPVRLPNGAVEETEVVQEAVAAPLGGIERRKRSYDALVQPEPLAVAPSCRYDPANSVNDSECAASSAGTDDATSMADSAGLRYGAPDFIHRAPLHPERTLRAAGGAGVPLDPPWAARVPPASGHLEPAAFADELIRRLNSVQIERHSQPPRGLEQEDEEREEEMEETTEDTKATPGRPGLPVLPALHPFALLLRAGAETDDDPERILDQHVSRVLRTPVCRSPTGRPRHQQHSNNYHQQSYHQQHSYHQHSHQHHHHVGAGQQAVGVAGGRGLPQDRGQHGTTGGPCSELMERPWAPPPRRRLVQPNHPFLQDPSMPPPPPPNTTVQLEEAKRRLEEERLVPLSRTAPPGKHKYVQEVIERGRSLARGVAAAAAAPIASATCTVTDTHAAEYGRRPAARRAGPRGPAADDEGGPPGTVVVAYYFCGEPIPYRSRVRGDSLTLAHFKELLTKKGNYRFYFKKASDEFECGVVFEEVRDDKALLPLYEGKVVGKVEKMEGGRLS